MDVAPRLTVRRGARAALARLGLLGRWPWLLLAAALAVAAGDPREVLLVALPEELLFRGLLQGEIAARTRRPRLAIAACAALFALAHAGLSQDPDRLATFVPGLLFGWLRHRSGSIWPAVGAHALSNVLWLRGS